MKIHALAVESFDGERAVLDVHCSKGTYIRTLAEDLGAALGSAAHLAGLRRTGAGAFSLDEAFDCEALARMTEAERDALLLPVDALVQALPRVDLDDGHARRFNAGQALPDAVALPGTCRVYAAGRFLGVGEGEAGGLLRPRRLLRGD